MSQSDFVYNQIYRGSINGGASDRCSLDAATTGLDSFKKNRFKGRVSKLITDKIAEAIRNTKKSK